MRPIELLSFLVPLVCAAAGAGEPGAPGDPPTALVRSAHGGRWSEPGTWEGGRLPGPGERVQVRGGHVVIYDIETTEPIRSIHVAGRLRFDPERDTRLDVGLIKIQAGDDPDETGVDCEAHVKGVGSEAERVPFWKSVRRCGRLQKIIER